MNALIEAAEAGDEEIDILADDDDGLELEAAEIEAGRAGYTVMAAFFLGMSARAALTTSNVSVFFTTVYNADVAEWPAAWYSSGTFPIIHNIVTF